MAETLEDTYETLKSSWWGIPESLHLDAWGILRWADGYEVHVKNTPPINKLCKLYFINLGGYDKQQFTELHKNIFIVAENDSNAKMKAVKKILNWESPHKDYQFEIEKIISIDELMEKQSLFLHLIPNPQEIPFEFTCKYLPIGKK
jgi:hypothetical protein